MNTQDWRSTRCWKCSSGPVFRGLSPPGRASLVTAGCEAEGFKPKGPRSILGATGEGKTGRMNTSEPLMMRRYPEPRRMEAVAGW